MRLVEQFLNNERNERGKLSDEDDEILGGLFAGNPPHFLRNFCYSKMVIRNTIENGGSKSFDERDLLFNISGTSWNNARSYSFRPPSGWTPDFTLPASKSSRHAGLRDEVSH